MKKTYTFLIILLVVLVIFLTKKNAMAPEDTSLQEPVATTTEPVAEGTPKPAASVKSPSPINLGSFTYTLPESSPVNARALQEKGYIEKRVFGNYKAETIATYIPISNSLSWDTLGYNATLFASETKEACHASTVEMEKYKSPSKIDFKIYEGSVLADKHQYAIRTYFVSKGSSCYNFGVFQEFKILEDADLAGRAQKDVEAKRDAESARVTLLLKKLVDSVNAQ